MIKHIRLLAILGLLLGGNHLLAKVELTRLFCDHMVMQRNMKVPVWGWADPGEEITVSIDKQVKSGRADATGKWMIVLNPMETGEPRKMTVRGKTETLEVNDILLGEVWICAGQSNMERELSQVQNGKAEVAAAEYPNIRFFQVGNAGSPDAPVDRLTVRGSAKAIWVPCSPRTASGFSAVGYFFARDLIASLKVPVGLIHNSVGATPAEAWLSRDAMLADPDLKYLVERSDRRVAYALSPEGKKELDAVFAEYDAKQAEARAAGGWFWRSDLYQEPKKQLSYPANYFNGRVNPLIPYAIRGVIWYQGEANTGMAYSYRQLFSVLIKDWRTRWGQGDFAFLYVQLANWGQPSRSPVPSDWAELRESQLKTLSVPNTAMAVSIDIGQGGDIHAKNKQDVGKRLALAARAKVYNERIVYSGPIYSSMKVEGSVIRLTFTQTGSGLMAGKKVDLDPVIENTEAGLKSFEIAGEDKRFVWATATIEGNSVVVKSDAVPQPVAVRYAWATNPADCNLYNKEGLPASPFRTDEWPGRTTDKTYKLQLDRPITFVIKK
ncbi:MAG TPA: sialate O-acetylesterase [Rariglobus sp.]|nr:sialate O-acetylesterase [Rariglobus sp.]